MLAMLVGLIEVERFVSLVGRHLGVQVPPSQRNVVGHSWSSVTELQEAGGLKAHGQLLGKLTSAKFQLCITRVQLFFHLQ